MIITSYNWPSALSMVLESVSKQTVAPDSVLVADDGSDIEVQIIVREWMRRFPYLRYIWQPDTGFRAARVRNLAALKTDADHLVFVDGDCLLPPSFIEKQRQLIGPNTLVAGGRYLADSKQTESLLYSGLVASTSLYSGVKFKAISLGPLRDLRPSNWRGVKTCNFAVMRRDFLNVAGFDESYIGWGREDTDLVIRLINAGVTIRSGRFGACVYHLYHDLSDRSTLPENDRRLQKVMDDSGIRLSGKSTVGSS